MGADQSVFRFGRFTLDPRRREFLADGNPVALHARTFDLLLYLIEHRDAPVSRDAVLAHVWAGRIVSQNNLSVQLHALRKVLAEGGRGDLILTLPGPSYRFVGDVAPAEKRDFVSDADAQAARSKTIDAIPVGGLHALRARTPSVRWAAWACVAAAIAVAALTVGARSWIVGQPTAPRLSIVVLPFRNLSDDRNLDHLAEAISDDLTSDLAHIPASTVIARESAEVVKHETPMQIGHDLKVRYLLDGSLSQLPNQVRVHAWLIDTATDAYLWDLKLDVDSGKIEGTRDVIVNRLASALHFQLDQIEGLRSLHDRPNDPDAIDLFLRARAILDVDETLPGYTKAQALLESAIAQQPDFGEALAKLGSLLLRKSQLPSDPDDEVDRIRAHAIIIRAKKLAPRNSEALAAWASELETGGRCSDAVDVANHVLLIESSNLSAHWVLANCSWKQGHLTTAASHLDALERLNPEGQSTRRRRIMQAHVDMLLNRPAEAITLLRSTIGAEPDASPDADPLGPAEYARILLVAAYAMDGQVQSAKDLYEAYKSVWSNRSVWRIAAYATKAEADLPGTSRILDALREAGMPQYGDEGVPTASGDPLCGDNSNEFSPTPTRINGIATPKTSQVVELLKRKPNPLVIDLGNGVAAIPGAKWEDLDNVLETSTDFVDRVVLPLGSIGSKWPIILMGDGPSGCRAVKAAEYLKGKGYTNIAWYRGGEEAWSHSGQPSVDHRQ